MADQLLNRSKSTVVVGGATSQPFPIAAGVPQGSVFSPTFFLLYVNDAVESSLTEYPHHIC